MLRSSPIEVEILNVKSVFVIHYRKIKIKKKIKNLILSVKLRIKRGTRGQRDIRKLTESPCFGDP